MDATRHDIRAISRLLAGLLAIFLVISLVSRAAAADPPNPIVPTAGEQNLLNIINGMPLNSIKSALDSFPVPYVVVAQAGNGPPVIFNNRAGSPTRVDADSSKATGMGGNDIQVEVNTELSPTNHLRVNINRLGGAPYATNLKVTIAFPFDAFNGETLPGAPNLFIGYQTTAAGGGPGGHAPLTEQIEFTPNILAGTNHSFGLKMSTSGAANPLRFVAGHFDGTNLTGILNADAMAVLAEPVPATIDLGLTVSESALSSGPGGTDSALTLNWAASAPSKVTFDYLEDETKPTASSDYNTTLTFDKMPTSERLALRLDEAAGTFTLAHTSNAPIAAVTLLHERRDGLAISGVANEVPTRADLTIGLAGSAALDVNANTLDLDLRVTQAGGFAGSDAFLGYNLGYLGLILKDAPDLTAGYAPATDSFSAKATNPGETIGAIALVLDDDGTLQLPAAWNASPARHVFSLVDDGTHGTAAARLLTLTSGTLQLNAATIDEVYTLTTAQPAPLQAYLKTDKTSQLIPNHDIEVTCDVVNFPYGATTFTLDPPQKFSYETNPKQKIAEIGCRGHIDTLNFDVLLGDLPEVFDYDFAPGSHLTVKAENGSGPNTATVGAIAVRVWDLGGPGLPGTGVLLGTPLRDARLRADVIPSFHATWADNAAGTDLKFSTDANDAFVKGVQLSVSTAVELTEPLAPATDTADDYLRFADLGGTGVKRLAVGVFGIDEFTYSSDDGSPTVTLNYDANAAHKLRLEIDARRGGRFFPNVTFDAKLTVDSIPQQFKLRSDLASWFNYTASAGIASVALDGAIDTTDNNTADGTTIFARFTGLPSVVEADLNGGDGQAYVHANGAVSTAEVELQSSHKILTTDYKWFYLKVSGITEKLDFIASYNEATEEAFIKVTSEPGPIGKLDALVLSKDTKAGSANKLDAFKNVSGGLVRRSAYQKVIDDRYFPQSVSSRLETLYGTPVQFDGVSDHLIVRKPDKTSYIDAKFAGLRSFTATNGPDGAKATVDAPVAGAHPFYVGYQTGKDDKEKYTLLQIEDLPDTISVDIVPADHVYFEASGSAGKIDAYSGPLPFGDEGKNATRAILLNTPSSVRLDFGNLDSFPGGASFQASNQFELLLLNQDASSRVVAGLRMEDLTIHYSLDGIGYSGCDPVDLEFETVDTCLGLFRVAAGINAVGNASQQGASGFLMLYDLEGSPAALTGEGTAPADGKEFIPSISVLLRDFRDFSVSFEIQLDPTGAGELYPIDFEFNVNGPNYGPGGGLYFDFWDRGFHEEFAGIEINNDPDYINNNPWHVVPVLHAATSHVDPYAP